MQRCACLCALKQGFCRLNGLFASSVTLKLFLQGWQKKNSLIALSQKRKKKQKQKGNKKSKKAYNTWYSQAVTHPSTNPARQGLTSVIGREPVLSLWYGRRQEKEVQISCFIGKVQKDIFAFLWGWS